MDTLTKLRSYGRVSNISMVDYVGSYLIIFIVITLLGGHHKPVYYLPMLPIAIIAHVLAGQKTALTNEFMSPEFNFTKAYVFFLVVYTAYLISIGDY